MHHVSPEQIESLYQQINKQIDQLPIYNYDFESTEYSQIPKIEFSSIINFNSESSVFNFLKNGWSFPEKNHIWSVGDFSDLLFKINETKKDLLIEVYGEPFIPKNGTSQSITVESFDQSIASWSCKALGLYSCFIPNRLIPKNKVILLRFKYKDPQSPCTQGTSSDARKLGFSFKSIQIKECL